MYPEYHCGKNPEVVCTAATYGALDLPCNTCQEWKKETDKIVNSKVKTYIAVADCYYLRNTQILCPEEKNIPTDTETDEFCNMYKNDDNWKNFRKDAYLGYYKWPEEDVEGLKQYIAKKNGLDVMTINVFPVED